MSSRSNHKLSRVSESPQFKQIQELKEDQEIDNTPQTMLPQTMLPMALSSLSNINNTRTMMTNSISTIPERTLPENNLRSTLTLIHSEPHESSKSYTSSQSNDNNIEKKTQRHVIQNSTTINRRESNKHNHHNIPQSSHPDHLSIHVALHNYGSGNLSRSSSDADAEDERDDDDDDDDDEDDVSSEIKPDEHTIVEISQTPIDSRFIVNNMSMNGSNYNMSMNSNNIPAPISVHHAMTPPPYDMSNNNIIITDNEEEEDEEEGAHALPPGDETPDIYTQPITRMVLVNNITEQSERDYDDYDNKIGIISMRSKPNIQQSIDEDQEYQVNENQDPDQAIAEIENSKSKSVDSIQSTAM